MTGRHLTRLADGASPHLDVADVVEADLDETRPLAVPSPVAWELWKTADVAIGIGTRFQWHEMVWGVDDDLKLIQINADPVELKLSTDSVDPGGLLLLLPFILVIVLAMSGNHIILSLTAGLIAAATGATMALP